MEFSKWLQDACGSESFRGQISFDSSLQKWSQLEGFMKPISFIELNSDNKHKQIFVL